MARTVKVDLTDDQERALSERGINLEQLIDTQVTMAQTEAAKARISRICDQVRSEGDEQVREELSKQIDAAIIPILDLISAKKPKVDPEIEVLP